MRVSLKRFYKSNTSDMAHDPIHDLSVLNAKTYRKKYQNYPLVRHPFIDSKIDTLFSTLSRRRRKHIPFLLEKEPINVAKAVYMLDEKKCLQLLKYLHSHGFPINVHDTYQGEEALQIAIGLGHKKVEEFLMSLGASYFISQRKNVTYVYPPTPNTPDILSFKKLCWRQYRWVYRFLFANYDVENSGSTLLQICECFHLTDNHALKSKMVSIRNRFGHNVVHWNVLMDELDLVKSFAAFEPRLLSEKDSWGRTPAFLCRRNSMVDFFVNSVEGCHRMLDDQFQTCRIYWDKAFLRPLLPTDVDLWLPEKLYLCSPLMHNYVSNTLRGLPYEVYSYELYTIVRIFLEEDCSVIPDMSVIRDLNGNTILHVASDYEMDLTIPLVNKFPELLSIKNRQLQTPLHLCKNDIMAKHMIEKGAHFELKDMYGHRYNFAVASLQCLAAMEVHSHDPGIPGILKPWVEFHS